MHIKDLKKRENFSDTLIFTLQKFFIERFKTKVDLTWSRKKE